MTWYDTAGHLYTQLFQKKVYVSGASKDANRIWQGHEAQLSEPGEEKVAFDKRQSKRCR